jgi:sigma-B regulation protein RsbU (phosphoserine phosphatase)
MMVENRQTAKKDDFIFSQLKEAEQKIRILYEITRFVASFLHLQHILDAIVDLLVKEFKLDACSIRQLDSNGNLKIKSHKGLSEAFIEKSTRKPTVDSYSGDCFLTGKIVIVNDATQIDKPISTNLAVGENIQSFALCPIKIEGEIIGVLGTASKKKNYFHERFNDMLYIVASQIGIAIRISQLYGDIYSMSQDLENKVKERTAELEQRTQQLIVAERRAALGEMSSMIAHELRNSLTIVGGFTKRLYEKMNDEDADKKDIKIIIDEIRLLEEKVSKIINLGKMNNDE